MVVLTPVLASMQALKAVSVQGFVGGALAEIAESEKQNIAAKAAPTQQQAVSALAITKGGRRTAGPALEGVDEGGRFGIAQLL